MLFEVLFARHVVLRTHLVHFVDVDETTKGVLRGDELVAHVAARDMTVADQDASAGWKKGVETGPGRFVDLADQRRRHVDRKDLVDLVVPRMQRG